MSSLGCQWIKWNWIQTKLNFSLLGMNDCRANISMITKAAFYLAMVDENSVDQYSWWKVFNHILHRHHPAQLPDYLSIADPPSSFGTDFINKIVSYLLFFTDTSAPDYRQSYLDRARLHSLTPAVVEEIHEIIIGSFGKYCVFKPIPTTLLSQRSSDTSNIIGKSPLSEGVFPKCLRWHMPKTRMLKRTLPKEEMKNCRVLCIKSKLHFQNHQEGCGQEHPEPHPGNWCLQSVPVCVQEISLHRNTPQDSQQCVNTDGQR